MNANVNIELEESERDAPSNKSQLLPRKKHLAAGLLTLGILLWLAVAGTTHANFDRLARVTAPGCGMICQRFAQFERAYCLEQCLKLPARMNKCEACHEVCRKHGGQPRPCKKACKPVCPRSKLREYLEKKKKAKVDIHGGSRASAKSFPTIVALEYECGHAWKFFCAGAIVTTQDVLTAGDCCHHLNKKVRVVAGDSSRSSTTGHEQTRLVKEMIRHPHANLCLLNLDSHFILTDYVLIAIPIENGSLPASGAACKFAGWGRSTASPSAMNDLHFTPMTTITDSSCLAKLVPYPGSRLPPDSVCAYNAFAGPCIGDLGGPLVRASNDRMIGVLGRQLWHGLTCKVGADNPAVFTEIEPHYKWVKDTAVGETCVSGKSIVRVREESGAVKVMRLSEIVEGDKIETMNGYEQVYFVVRSSTREAVAMRRMVIESVCGGEGERPTISLTKEHLVFDGAGRLTRADKLSVGDVLSLRDCQGRVVELSESMEEPMSVVTDSGEFLLANGVRVSTYSFSPAFAKFAHGLTSPLRAVSRVFGKNVGSWVGQVLGLDRVLRPSVWKGFGMRNGVWMSIL